MKECSNTFMRYELKYLVTSEQRQAITDLAENYMRPDEFGKSTICSVYYDTPDMRLIRRSIEKPIYKEKLRMRSYGIPDAGDKVFVELKKKYKEVVYKRRVSMTEEQAEKYLSGKTEVPKHSQITSELDYFLTFYQNIMPSVFISCERSAFFGKDDSNLRITFDSDILWRDYDLSLLSGIYGKPLLGAGQSLMEIKISGAMPLWLSHKLSELGIYKVNFSKYGNAYMAMQKKTEGGCCCA